MLNTLKSSLKFDNIKITRCFGTGLSPRGTDIVLSPSTLSFEPINNEKRNDKTVLYMYLNERIKLFIIIIIIIIK